MSPVAISIQAVEKSYGQHRAVDSLSLEIEEGELVAVLGPNGAGKTTTIEMLEGYRRPDRGRIEVLGLSPITDARRFRPLVGIMLQEGGIYPTIRVGEAARLFAGYFARPESPTALLERVGLADKVGSRYRQLSGGEKQRLSLALALVGRPRVLFLDEPTAGMDPRARLLTWQLVGEQQRAGVTVVLTTHSMEEAEHLADRVAIVKSGRLVAYDSPARLRSGAGPDLVHVELESELPAAQLERLRHLSFVERVEDRGQGRYDLVSRDPAQTAAALTQMLLDGGPQLLLLRVGRSSLEDVFLDLTEEAES
ncbi:MAG: ABC transporter ATP-binding protein [Candidatus Dormibacteria bacterium]